MQIWLDDGIGRAEERLRRSGGILRPGLEHKLSRDDTQKLAKPSSLCPVWETVFHRPSSSFFLFLFYLRDIILVSLLIEVEFNGFFWFWNSF